MCECHWWRTCLCLHYITLLVSLKLQRRILASLTSKMSLHQSLKHHRTSFSLRESGSLLRRHPGDNTSLICCWSRPSLKSADMPNLSGSNVVARDEGGSEVSRREEAKIAREKMYDCKNVLDKSRIWSAVKYSRYVAQRNKYQAMINGCFWSFRIIQHNKMIMVGSRP